MTARRMADDGDAFGVDPGGKAAVDEMVVAGGDVGERRGPGRRRRAVVDVPTQVAARREVETEWVFEVPVVARSPESAMHQDDGREGLVARRGEPLTDLPAVRAVLLDDPLDGGL